MTTEYDDKVPPEGGTLEDFNIPADFDPHGRSLFDFTDEELEQVITTEAFPEGTTLIGIEDQENFDKLWRYRNNPAMLAKAILRKRVGGRISKEPVSVKEQRNKLKELELELKMKKADSAMHYQKIILDRLDKIDLVLRRILQKLE